MGYCSPLNVRDRRKVRKPVIVAERATIASTFEEIRSRAELRWQQLWNRHFFRGTKGLDVGE
jgi:hypothetical protein